MIVITDMLLQSLFIILLILAFVVIFYRAAIHEYTILQKDWSSVDSNWKELISERAPLVVRDIPTDWTKQWTAARTGRFGWPVILSDGKNKSRSSWSSFINSKSLNKILNRDILAEAAGINEHAVTISNEFRRPFWLPGSFSVGRTVANVIKPNKADYVGLKKTTAEATCIVSTDGAPMRVWLAHEGATKGGAWLPANPYGRDPWSLKPEETPWISELKFLEIRLRKGNMLILPPHWWVAFRCLDETGGENKNGSWYWMSELHSPISLLATTFHNKD
jgi:hypothetical protein